MRREKERVKRGEGMGRERRRGRERERWQGRCVDSWRRGGSKGDVER